jgi:predicted MFS family arabinose efflux permease
VDVIKRKMATLIYALMLVVTGMVTSPLTPVSKTAARIFDTSIPMVTFSSTIYSFSGILFGIPANMIVAKIGIKKSVWICALLFTIGTGIRRFFFQKNFYFVLIGQAIEGIGGPFVCNAIGGFTEHWYTGKKVGISVSIIL